MAQSLYAGSLGDSNLTEPQQLNRAELIGAFAGYAFSGGVAANVSAGGSVARSGIENNYLFHAEARERAVAESQLRRCEERQDCSSSDIANYRRTIAELNKRDSQRDQNLITACDANPHGSQCLGFINELAYAVQIYHELPDPFNIGGVADNFVLDYRNAYFLANYGDTNGVPSAMLSEQASGQALLNRYQSSFELVQQARYQDKLLLLGADAIMALAGAGLIRMRGGVVSKLTPTEISRANLPDLPNGYHYRTIGPQVQVVRNPGQAGNLPQMHLEGGKLALGPTLGVVRSTSVRPTFLRRLANSDKVPSSIRPWLLKGEVPPGYAVHHRKALFDGGTDTIDNLVLQGVDLHKLTHRFYRPGGQIPSINPPLGSPY